MAGSLLVHDFSQHAPDCCVECGAPAAGYDERLILRIAAALRRSLDHRIAAADDVWTPIVAKHKYFIDLLTTGQLQAANDVLARMFATPLTYGFEQSNALYEMIASNHQYVGYYAFDRLLSLAASLRAIPLQNGEQGDFMPYLRASPDSLLDRIEAKLQREIRAPGFQGALFGMTTKRGRFTERLITAIYVALRARELVNGMLSPSICEIGGGAGYVAYYCDWLGLTDYTIVDLPTVSAVQAYFLARNLGGGAEQIVLSGEAEDPSGRVNLISGADFTSGLRHFDLAVNIDSFPEMSGPVLHGYLSHIRTSCRYLLSINQEAMAPRAAGRPDDHQERVGDVIEEIGGFRRLARAPFWMRPGYVEEIYEAI